MRASIKRGSQALMKTLSSKALLAGIPRLSLSTTTAPAVTALSSAPGGATTLIEEPTQEET